MSRMIPTLAAACALAITMIAPTPSSAAEAMRVVRDAGTGELRAPTAAEAAAFEKAEAQLRASNTGKGASRAPAAPAEIHHPDGSVERQLGEDTHMYSVVTTAADGSLAFDCLPAKQANAKVKSSSRKSALNKSAAKVAAKTKDGHAH